MLKYLLKNSDLGALSGFISPGFFSVVPISQSLAVATTLLRNSKDTRGWAEAKRELNQRLPDSVSIIDAPSRNTSGEAPVLDQSNAERVLEVFFRQILNSPVWLLDLRAARWNPSAERLDWNPASYYYRPSPGFREAVASLYEGFYTDDVSKFRASLKTLGIAPAEQALRDHFGLEGQAQVQFKLRAFQSSFSKVFAACEKQGSKIHSEFAALGVMLVSLYETLEKTGFALDVRGAFFRALGTPNQDADSGTSGP